MAVGWDGATPTQQDDGSGTFYELGVAITVVEDITVSAVRVWHGASSNTVTGRTARVWTTGGVVVDTVVLDDALPSGWTTFEFDAPLELTADSQIVLSYSTRQFYGAVPAAFPNASADGAVEFTGGRFAESASFPFPTTVSAAFYGVDLVYELGIGGNLSPSVTVAATVAGRTVTATATVDDESPGTVAYRWEFGDGTVVADGGPVEEHTYGADGIYAVLVTVTDAGGLKDAAAVPVVARVGAPGGMILLDVINALADRLDTVPGLKVYRGWPRRVSVPCVIVAYPEIDYDTTYGRGSDTLDVPVVVLLSRINDDGELRDASAYASGFGTRAVKSVIESGEYTAFKYVRVRDGAPDVHTMAGTEYLAYVHGVTVVG